MKSYTLFVNIKDYVIFLLIQAKILNFWWKEISEKINEIKIFFFYYFSCEVIKDEITGNSLQYAFIEFDNRKSCEDAYFKMDNVLIDDRRIHVDFSQSVAKYKWKGKGI